MAMLSLRFVFETSLDAVGKLILHCASECFSFLILIERSYYFISLVKVLSVFFNIHLIIAVFHPSMGG